MLVINQLEAVDIGHENRQRPPALYGTLEQRGEMRLKIEPIMQPGQTVSHRHFVRLDDAGAQPVMIRFAPQLRTQSRQQFIRVQRSYEIVVHTKFQGTPDQRFFALIRHKDDR